MDLIFDKYHGAGNDFIIIDGRSLDFRFIDHLQIKNICNRNFGIGADGLILIKDHNKLDFEMIYYNSDGLLSSMCGNGARCSVAFAYEKNICSKETVFMAYDGPHKGFVLLDSNIKLSFNDISIIEKNDYGLLINSGSPHLLIYKKNLDKIDIKELGSSIRYSKKFLKEGVNVNFIEHIYENKIKLRTYERGVEDETLSCGSGAVAAAVSVHYNALVKGFSEILIETLGGTLKVNFNFEEKTYNKIYLSGKAQKVFSGKILI